jgi:hypothetical protein
MNQKAVRISRIVLTLVVVSSIILSVVPASAVADTSNNYSQTWTEQLSGIYNGVALDSNGDVYVANRQSDVVQKLDGDTGNLLCSLSIGTSGTGVEVMASNEHGVYLANDTHLTMIHGSCNVVDAVSTHTTLNDLSGSGDYVGGQYNEVEYFQTNQSGFQQSYSYTGSVGNAFAINESGYFFIDDSSNNAEIRDINGNLQGQIDRSNFDGDPHAMAIADNDGITGTFSNATTNRFSTTSIIWTDSYQANVWVSSMESDEEKGVVASGYNTDKGEIEVFNHSDGSLVDDIDFSDDSGVVGVDARDGNLVGLQYDGSIQYWELPEPTSSIDLQINDKTLLPSQSSSYTVEDASSSDITSSSQVSSDNPSVVSVDEVSQEVSYQSDGTTTIRANYTNLNGETLWDNETVETDTPEIDIQANVNPVEIDERANYTVTQTLFGSTTDVTGSATVSSDNSSILTVTQANSTYKGVSVGFANLTADVTVSGDTYSDKVEVEVIEPQAVTWANWNFLTPSEKMILMLSDWSILYMLGSLLVSVMIGVKLRASRVAYASFGLLIGAGWIIGFVPNYVALSVIIFSIFIAFLVEFISTQQPISSG